MKLNDYKNEIEAIKNLVEIVAILGVGGYFLFQAFVGSFVISMELEPKAEFVNTKEGSALNLSLSLKSGNYGSVRVNSISYKIQDAISNEVIVPYTKFEGVTKVDIDSKAAITERIRLSPGDRKIFSEFKVLKYDRPIKVEFLVIGARDNSFFTAQWKSSIVVLKSLPSK
ncbi:hypothetical protein [Pseudoalteromonas sp. MMG022]|uniref:hypothetical protein n=1 Tax=Pseudoalteromonas sp. MMG022 TaxID=2909978 RepID=UPI001F24CCB1|nr:hypothetical protein [Pseudoalteromonas sp. MMG022]MCF6437603.1 hypothetical protein [Pseudoalteromonas sp. MMG022]